MKDHIQQYIESTPGGIMVIFDLIFKDEYEEGEKSLSSILGLQKELDRLEKLLELK